MPCPNSKEDGYHRYRLPDTGRELDAVCIYCGQPRVFRPFADGEGATVWDDHRANGNAASNAAKRRNANPLPIDDFNLR